MSQSPFDPFADVYDDNDRGTAASRTGTHTTNTSKTTNTTNKYKRVTGAGAKTQLAAVREQPSTRPLPPRLNVRLTLHEEVSSTAVMDPEGEGGSLSQLSIEGKVMARVDSSNANKNTPFILQISGPMASLANVLCNNHCVLHEDEEDATLNAPFSGGGTIDTVRCKVDIPKKEVAGCEILRYSINVRTQNMPILVQAKVSVKSNVCRISVQIRSNLSNQGDLSNFTIIVAIPTTIRGETVKVTRGERGVWDANARIVTWKIGHLPHGESCLVGAEANVSSAVANLLRENPFAPEMAENKIQCPVLVRCLSEVDQVSDLTLSAMALIGEPATIVQNDMRSYQLLHRVGKTGV
mmetsp:Transcript_15823/g.34245  ORF Transcript_15823/g.34245 Transcript_15823/m.34245 type:complete len:352 (-) Transcript_15823:1366-2421(-)